MFISAVLTLIREQKWMYLHDSWIKLLISCLPKLGDDMSKVIVPVVAQLCVNLKAVTKLFNESYNTRESDCPVELPPDHMLILLDGITSFCHYCLINTTSFASAVMSGSRPGARAKVIDDPSSSLFSNLVHAFSTSPAPPSKITSSDEGIVINNVIGSKVIFLLFIIHSFIHSLQIIIIH